MKRFFSLLVFVISILSCSAQIRTADEILTYKNIDTISLKLWLYYPSEKPVKPLPAIVFFFGGGWIDRNITQFEQHAIYFADRGIVSILADYRTQVSYNSTPFDAVCDAKSAIRYIRANSSKLMIDPEQIIAAGGSAGGHLAAATAFVSKYNDISDNLSIPSKPQALVLFNPVIDNSENGYGYERVGLEYLYFSPLHNIKSDAPPTVVFLGSKDKYIPIETIEDYQQKMKKVGAQCNVFIYNGQHHGFFNYRKDMENKYFNSTLYETDLFLISLGFLSGQPTIAQLIKYDKMIH